MELSKEESHHAISVFRLKSGDVVELFDGQGQKFSGVVTGEKNHRLSVMVSQNIASTASSLSITLAQAVIRPERMELMIPKACELGVSVIQPLICERSIVKLSKERWASKLERWRKIALESCKQCGQTRIPVIAEIRLYKEFLQDVKSYDLILIPTLAVPNQPLHQAIAQKKTKNALVLIGPEGDFTPKEVALASQAGAVAVSLGDLVLRSETASLYLLAVLRYQFSQKA